MRNDLVFKRATKEDIERYYNGPPPVSMVAMVVTLNGEPIAIGGVSFVKGRRVGFSEMKPEMRGRKKDILRFAKLVMELVTQYNDVIVLANKDEPHSNAFLTWLGFEYLRKTEQGELYACPSRKLLPPE